MHNKKQVIDLYLNKLITCLFLFFCSIRLFRNIVTSITRIAGITITISFIYRVWWSRRLVTIRIAVTRSTATTSTLRSSIPTAIVVTRYWCLICCSITLTCILLIWWCILCIIAWWNWTWVSWFRYTWTYRTALLRTARTFLFLFLLFMFFLFSSFSLIMCFFFSFFNAFCFSRTCFIRK